MTMNTKKKLLPVMLSAGVALTAISGLASAETNPFSSQELTAGYQLAADDSGFKKEGKCGEAKCGANAADKLDKAAGPGDTKSGFKQEGKCGEAKCGANAADKLDKAAGPGETEGGFKPEGE